MDGDGYSTGETTYDSGGRVASRRTPFHHTVGGQIDFVPIGAPTGSVQEVEVHEPYQGGSSVTRFGMTAAPASAVDVVRVYSNDADRGPTSGYPGAPDPTYWEVHFEVDSNLYPTRQYLMESGVSGWSQEVTWEYVDPAPLDPRHRGLLARYTERGDGSSAAEHVWTYPSGSYIPTTYEDHTGAVETYTFDAGGQLLTRSQAGLAHLGSGQPYAIEERFTYDARGRQTQHWDPNRLHFHGPSSEPSRTLAYHGAGPCVGYLQRRAARSTAGTDLATLYDYDLHGNVIAETNPAGETFTHEYDARDRRIRTTSHSPRGPTQALR